MENKEESIDLFQFLKGLADRETEIINGNSDKQLRLLSELKNDLNNPDISTDNLKKIRRIILELRIKLKSAHSGTINLNFHGKGNYEIANNQIKKYRKELKGILEECEIRLSNRSERETIDLEYIIDERKLIAAHQYFTEKWGLSIGSNDFKKLFCLEIDPTVLPKFKHGGQQPFCYFLSLLKDQGLIDLTDKQSKERFGFSYKSVMQRVKKDSEKPEKHKAIKTIQRREIDRILDPSKEVQLG